MWRRTLRSTTTKKECLRNKKLRKKRKGQRLSRCSQMSPWHHFSDDQLSLLMVSCSSYPAAFGVTVHNPTQPAAHTYSVKTTSPNHHSPSKQTSSLFWYVNSVQYCSRNPIQMKDCSNSHITWYLPLPLQIVSWFTILIIWSQCMVWVISILQRWLIWRGEMIRLWLCRHRMGLFRSFCFRIISWGRFMNRKRERLKKWLPRSSMCRK